MDWLYFIIPALLVSGVSFWFLAGTKKITSVASAAGSDANASKRKWLPEKNPFSGSHWSKTLFFGLGAVFLIWKNIEFRSVLAKFLSESQFDKAVGLPADKMAFVCWALLLAVFAWLALSRLMTGGRQKPPHQRQNSWDIISALGIIAIAISIIVAVFLPIIMVTSWATDKPLPWETAAITTPVVIAPAVIPPAPLLSDPLLRACEKASKKAGGIAGKIAGTITTKAGLTAEYNPLSNPKSGNWTEGVCVDMARDGFINLRVIVSADAGRALDGVAIDPAWWRTEELVQGLTVEYNDGSASEDPADWPERVLGYVFPIGRLGEYRLVVSADKLKANQLHGIIIRFVAHP